MTGQLTTGTGTGNVPPVEPPVESVAVVPRDRRKLFAVLRWAAAVVVFAAAGAGTAYGITQQQRTDLPGLSTRADGRWTYPAQARPTPPPGAPLPAGADNKGATHYADLSALMLAAPVGARPDTAFKADKDAVVPSDAFLEEYPADARPKLKESLEWDGLRKITGRSWIMPDGTRTRIYLLRFHSSGFVDSFQGCKPDVRLAGAASLSADPEWMEVGVDADTSAVISGTDVALYEEPKPFGEAQTRLGCLQAGDVQAVIIQSRKGGAAMVPFHQTLVLQRQLLG
ncbi:hypothetical protein [Streptomyces sp. NPDC058279]|uniref:hypothetical protein n=1 Tax=Streptomyces sp. NPDC058279 TaxID=3346418 RepID=UPI0036E71D30